LLKRDKQHIAARKQPLKSVKKICFNGGKPQSIVRTTTFVAVGNNNVFALL
jgi:hypothetical protein